MADHEYTPPPPFRPSRVRRLTYVGWGGKTLELMSDVQLGHGSTRGYPKFGIRRAVWDAAFGFVNGFRFSAILYFILTRSLSPRIRAWAMKREGIEFVDGIPVAKVRLVEVAADEVQRMPAYDEDSPW